MVASVVCERINIGQDGLGFGTRLEAFTTTDVCLANHQSAGVSECRKGSRSAVPIFKKTATYGTQTPLVFKTCETLPVNHSGGRLVKKGPQPVSKTEHAGIGTDSLSPCKDAGPELSTDDSNERSSTSSLPIFKRRWEGVCEVTCNVIGTFGFVVGSLLWCVGVADLGAYIFAAACALAGASCCIYTVKFWKNDDLIGVYALAQQAAGCYIFFVASFMFLYPSLTLAALVMFLMASVVFVLGCVLTQLQCRSVTGVLAPFLPRVSSKPWIPTSLCNTVGSVLFTVGSIALFFSSAAAQALGAWLYTIGSTLFFFASWGDATLWYRIGLTQSEHQQISSHEAQIANVKFV